VATREASVLNFLTDDGEVVSLMHKLCLTPVRFLVLISFKRLSNPGAIVQQEELGKWKTSNDIGI
jgi:hypothetical protein